MHHHEHFWWKFFPKKEMTEIYISVAIRAFALSLLSLFVPLYLYIELGYGLSVVLGFFIVYALVFALATPGAAKIAARIGLKHCILLSVPMHVIYYFLLYGLKSYPIPVYLVSVFFGLGNAFFWIAFHIEFAKVSDHNHRGEEVGKRQAVGLAAWLVGPLVGGVLIDWIGFGFVFVLASVLLFFSAIFLFFSKEVHIPFKFSLKDVLNREYLRDGLVFISRGIWDISTWVLWPMFIFFILKNYTSLGILGSVFGAVTSVMVFYVGKASDKRDKRKLIRIGLVDSLTWWLRPLAASVAQVFGFTVFSGLAYVFVQVPLMVLVYDKAQKKKEELVEFFIWREIFLCVGRVLVLLVVLLTGKFVYGFVLTGISNFAYLLF